MDNNDINNVLVVRCDIVFLFFISSVYSDALLIALCCAGLERRLCGGGGS